MKIERGNRRIYVITIGLISLILISVLALFVSVHGVAVLLVTGGAIGGIIGLYFRNDEKTKVAQATAEK